MPKPLISVVMATYQRRGVLERTLPTVFAQDFPPEQFEVIVVVDGSTDGTVEMLSSLKAACAFRVIEQANRGPAAARQVALDLANGEFVFFTDDDIQFTPDVLKHHFAAHRRSAHPTMVRGSILVAPESPQTLATDATRRWYERHAQTFAPEGNGVNIREDFSIFANTSVPRRSIEQCGGFDDTVPFPQEGFELLYRLLKLGVFMRSAPEALVYELYSKPTRKLITSDARGLGKAEWILCQKHPEYRAQSVFANFGQGGPIKQWMRKAMTSAPFIPNLLLDATIYAADHLRALSPVRGIGIRALSYRYRSEVLQSGLAQAGSWTALECSIGLRVPVLMYHHVGPRLPHTYYELTIEPKQFAQQVKWLSRNGYKGICASDWLNWKCFGIPLPEKPVLLTFDDAYADTFEFALPVLAEYGFSATVFVVSALVGKADAWNETNVSKSVLKLATRDQIREWASRGIEIGGHSRTHADLTKLNDQQLRDEIVEGKEELSRIAGMEPVSFAYPYGEYNAESEQMVRCTYSLAFSVIAGLNTICTDCHLLRRLMIDPRRSLFQFGRIVKTGRIAKPSIINKATVQLSRLVRSRWR